MEKDTIEKTVNEKNIKQEEKLLERQTAKIVSIGELIKGKYIKQEGWEPNYVLSPKKEKISRVNIIGVVVTIPDLGNSVFIDDGTGKIEIKTFEENSIFKGITIGDIILVIGKPREFNNSIYINAEIIKKINNKGWLEYRKKEILLRNILYPDIEEEYDLNYVSSEEEQKIKNTKEIDLVEEILMKIKALDTGSGCDVNILTENNPENEKIIHDLLLRGEIYEILPGKVKILE